MTRDEVEAVLATPPGHYRSDGGVSNLKQPLERSLVWDRDDGFVVVQFDPAGTVQEAKLYPGPRPPSLIRRWLQRLP